MNNKVIIITGASDGIGAAAAQELHKAQARVIIVGRSPEKTKHVASMIDAPFYLADFTKLREVRELASQLKQNYPRIDVLINNAGGVFGERELTEDEHEKTLQVNYLAPFLLTNLLIDTLTASHATVINTASIANERYGRMDINDLDMEKNYTPERAYGNSKLANILFTQELHRRYHDLGLSTVAVHPGNIASNFAYGSKASFRFVYTTALKKIFLQSVEKGAEPLVWLATTTPGTEWLSGEYYEKHKLGKINDQAKDPKLAHSLWKLSKKYTSLA
jgi:NAD(P)-dependent dehydrogenase (short-subunit alcohol dehydrogenase family)